ncbi:MAG: hypothetical protein IPG42_20705 [Betaproteobacteria bacterium]|nr:hypothetical protein [Betaproteobacteria bacterium]
MRALLPALGGVGGVGSTIKILLRVPELLWVSVSALRANPVKQRVLLALVFLSRFLPRVQGSMVVASLLCQLGQYAPTAS